MSPSGPIELATVRQSVAHLISTQGQRRAVAELAVDGALIQSTLFQYRLHRGHRFSRRCSKPWPVRFRDLRPGDEDRKSGPDGRVVEYFGHILVPQRDASGCPVAGDMPGWIETAARTVDGVQDVEVRLTFNPPWDPSRMSDEARLALNML